MPHADLRHLPSVPAIAALLRERGLVVAETEAMALARGVQERTRQAMLAGSGEGMNAELARQLDALTDLFDRSRYRPAINATGIVIHTNLGRAPVSDAAAASMARAAASNVALEIEPETGRRGGRMSEIARMLAMLTGAEAALVVNNNAAAILLVLSALTAGRSVAVSRAEAVEIGGGFRVPDVLRQSGANLVEVGTTNRTYAHDYAHEAIGEGDALLKVHASNFAITGFVAVPSRAELREVASERGALLIEDLGSGTLIDTARFGIDHEPTVAESLAAGVDVVTFSGDKLLGGPQAGIIAGRADLVARIERAPLARAVRADKVTLAGIAATLRHYLRGDAVETIPVLRMLAEDPVTLRRRAERIARQVDGVEVVETTNFVGGGSLPGQALPGIALRLLDGHGGAEALAQRLRLEPDPPVYGRIETGAVLLELRTVDPRDADALRAAIERVLTPGS